MPNKLTESLAMYRQTNEYLLVRQPVQANVELESA